MFHLCIISMRKWCNYGLRRREILSKTGINQSNNEKREVALNFRINETISEQASKTIWLKEYRKQLLQYTRVQICSYAPRAVVETWQMGLKVALRTLNSLFQQIQADGSLRALWKYANLHFYPAHYLLELWYLRRANVKKYNFWLKALLFCSVFATTKH